MMQETATLNPLETEFFVWFDAGYVRRRGTAPRLRPIVQVNFTAQGLHPNQVFFHSPFHELGRFEIAGGAWGGTAGAIERVYQHYFETFWHMAVNKIDCVGFEQHVFQFMCQIWREDLCAVHFHGEWFAMKFMLRKKDMDFSDSIELPVNQTLHSGVFPTQGFVPIPFPRYRPVVTSEIK